MAAEETNQKGSAVATASASASGLALHELIREQRRAAGLSQQDLANRAGIKQSALSTYERHGPEAQALSRENIAEVAEILAVPLPDSEDLPRSSRRFALHFCPEPDCPGVISYALGPGRTGYRPRFVRAPTDRPLYCTDCGEICERACAECGADISSAWHGAFCPSCGTAYIDGEVLSETELDRRRRCREELSGRTEIIEFRHPGDAPRG